MKPVKILISRTDRLGDVLLSLPVLEYVRTTMPQAEIDFLVQTLYVPVIDPYLKKIGVSAVTDISKPYTHFLALYSESSVVWRLFCKGTSVRVGNYSKPWSFLMLSEGLRQKRSDALKSEAEYNLDLAQVLVKRILGNFVQYTKPKIEIPLEREAQSAAIGALAKVGIAPNQPFTLFHPGMRGSALNLSPKRYLDLIDRAEEAWRDPVVLSIGPVPRDSEICETILKAKPYLKIVRNLEISVLREFFRLAKVVVAPSTGPLHLAHYVGTRTIGLYPPVKTQNAIRWAPWGGSGFSSVYFPNVNCLGEKSCLGNTCAEYSCMEQMNWEKSLPFEMMR